MTEPDRKVRWGRDWVELAILATCSKNGCYYWGPQLSPFKCTDPTGVVGMEICRIGDQNGKAK